MQYPEEAYANQIDGRVFVTFVIEKDGVVSHVRVVRSAHPLLDAEDPAGGFSECIRNGNRLLIYVGKAVRFDKILTDHVQIYATRDRVDL